MSLSGILPLPVDWRRLQGDPSTEAGVSLGIGLIRLQALLGFDSTRCLWRVAIFFIFYLPVTFESRHESPRWGLRRVDGA